MSLAVLLILLAIVLLALGLIVTALKWALIIAAVLFVAGLVVGFFRRTTSSV
jgi:uncharacterized membrane protein YoaK (UPF0700 family)